MDPNVILQLIREATIELRKQWLSDTESYSADLVEQLLANSVALDEWLSKGGYLPEVWVTDTVKRQVED